MLHKLPLLLLSTVTLIVSFVSRSEGLYFGYYDTNLTETSSYSSIYQASSVSEAISVYNAYKIPSLLLVYDTFFTSVPYHMILRSDYLDNWNTLLPEVIPLLTNGTLLGFNLGDELVWNCLAPSNLTIAANTVRNSFPRRTRDNFVDPKNMELVPTTTTTSSSTSAIVWYNEAAVFGTPSSFKDSCGNLVTDYTIPTALDWFSVDIYHMDGIVVDWVSTWVKSYYDQWIFPNITSEQSVILVPGSFGSDVNHYPNGTYICNRTCYDYMCSHDAYDFVNWAKNDSRIVAILPWNFGGCPTCNGSRFTPPHTCCMDELGTQVMNRTKDTWKSLFSGGLEI